MTAALLLGAGVGVGLFCAWAGLRPAPTRLEAVLARLEAPPPPAGPGPAPAERLGRRVAGALAELGVDHGRRAADLRVTGRSLEWLCAARLVAAVAGAALVVVAGTAAGLAGAGLPLGLWAVLAAAAAVGGFWLPVVRLASAAAGRRRDFRFALSGFANLVAVALAAGSAVEEALVASARVGRGWAFAELRATTEGLRRSAETPWAALGRLGAELGVEELAGLAATLALAGTEGARASDALAARAASLRQHRLAEAEAEANRRIETSRLPLVAQFFALATLAVAPAVLRLAQGLG